MTTERLINSYREFFQGRLDSGMMNVSTFDGKWHQSGKEDEFIAYLQKHPYEDAVKIAAGTPYEKILKAMHW